MGLKTKKGGSMPTDSNSNSVQIANNIRTQDATTPTKVESPKTVSSSVLEFKIPENAAKMVIGAIGADLRIGTNSTLDATADKGYFIIPDGSSGSFDIADKGSIFALRNAAADVTMSFFFKML